MRLLLHCCCAPCSGAILESLLADGIRPTLCFGNPNIVPEEEYLKRKDELLRYAGLLGLECIDDDYDHDGWLCRVKGHESDPERGGRCFICFHHRLLRSARFALANGFDTLATTLASSRWKDLSQVDKAGREAVAQALQEAGLAFDAGAELSVDAGAELSVDAKAELSASAKAELSASAKADGLTAHASDGQQNAYALRWWGRNWRKGGLQERRGQIIREQGFYNQNYCGCEFSFRTEEK